MTTIPARVSPFVLATPPSGKKPFTPLPIKQNSPQNNFLTPLQQDSVLFTGKKTAASSAARSANVPIALNNKEACRYRELCYKTKRNKQEQQEYDAFAKKIQSARAERNNIFLKISRGKRESSINKTGTLISPKTGKTIKKALKDSLTTIYPETYKAVADADKKAKRNLSRKLFRDINSLFIKLGTALEEKGYTAESPPTHDQIKEVVNNVLTPEAVASLSRKRKSPSQNEEVRSEDHASLPEQQRRARSVESESEIQVQEPNTLSETKPTETSAISTEHDNSYTSFQEPTVPEDSTDDLETRKELDRLLVSLNG
jgi:hypothetical protein